jgi:hypothetical protein
LITGRGHEKIMTNEIISSCANPIQWLNITVDLIIGTGSSPTSIYHNKKSVKQKNYTQEEDHTAHLTSKELHAF